MFCFKHIFMWHVEASLNVMAHAQKPDFVFRRNGRVHLNRRGRQFSRLLAADVCASAVVMLDTPCSEAVWRLLATHSIRQFPLHFPSRASPCAITFQLESKTTFLPFHCHCDYYRNLSHNSWVKRDQLDVTCFIISLFNAQHVSDVNTSETCRALSKEIINQVASSWSLFTQLSRWCTFQ